MKFIAFDSGIERTGWAVFDTDNPNLLIKTGCIFTKKKDSLEKRFVFLRQNTKALINQYRPDHIVIEQIFFYENKKTFITVAQSQGVMLELFGEYKIPVTFLAPLQIKQTITGYGRSDKESVKKMIKILTGFKEMTSQDDIIDAIACGLTFLQLSGIKKIV